MDNEKIPELNDKILSSVEKLNVSTGPLRAKKRSNLKGRWRRANGRACVTGLADENKPGIIAGESDVPEVKDNKCSEERFSGETHSTFVSSEHKKRLCPEPFLRSKEEKEFSQEHRNKKADGNFPISYKDLDKGCCVCGGVKAFFKKIIAFFGGKKPDSVCNTQEKDPEKRGYDRSRRSSSRNFQKHNKKQNSFRRSHSSRKRPQQ